MVGTCRNKYVHKDTNIKRKCTQLHVGSVNSGQVWLMEVLCMPSLFILLPCLKMFQSSHMYTHTHTFIRWFQNFTRMTGISHDAEDQYILMQFSMNITKHAITT